MRESKNWAHKTFHPLMVINHTSAKQQRNTKHSSKKKEAFGIVDLVYALYSVQSSRSTIFTRHQCFYWHALWADQKTTGL